MAYVILVLGIGALLAGAAIAYFTARTIAKPLTEVAAQLTANSEQTAAAAQQVSSASNQLATGATQQAASLEETSSSLEEMSSMTQRNADDATTANRVLKEEAMPNFQEIEGCNGRMVTAIDAAVAAAKETAKIVKTIDEIAFQTNILALNAAVEAAAPARPAPGRRRRRRSPRPRPTQRQGLAQNRRDDRARQRPHHRDRRPQHPGHHPAIEAKNGSPVRSPSSSKPSPPPPTSKTRDQADQLRRVRDGQAHPVQRRHRRGKRQRRPRTQRPGREPPRRRADLIAIVGARTPHINPRSTPPRARPPVCPRQRDTRHAPCSFE
jgi:TolA-binding protein